MSTQSMTTYDLARIQGAGPSAEVENALVGQKDGLLDRLGRCDDADDFAALLAQLAFAAPLWGSLGYGYKVKEIATLAVNRMYARLAEARDVRDGCRRGTSRRYSWDQEVGRLDGLITDACLMRA
jgi:hypothetical protein